MTKRQFHINLDGRVRKIKTKDFLVPLHEAISNSIHSIEEGNEAGCIDVRILRSPRQTEIAETQKDAELPITGFSITDNGVGFNEVHMASFCEADSVFKAKLGGKGVGRLSWLKFFEKAAVESVFQHGTKRTRRNFVFSLTGIEEDATQEVTSTLSTTVLLDPLRLGYEPRTRKSLEQIAIDLVEHFIAYLVTRSLPTLRIHDGAATQNIGELYQGSIGKHTSKHEFTIKTHRFEATGIKFFLGSQPHTAFLCGDKRVSDRMALGKRDPFFSKRFTDEELNQYAFQVFVQSEYLDQIVHDDRDGFRFPEPRTIESLVADAVTRDEIADEVLKFSRTEMSSEIERLKASNIETVTSFVSRDAPQYRRLLAKNQAEISSIHESDKAKIDTALRRIQFDEETKTKNEIGVLMKKAEEVGGGGTEEWTKRSGELLEKLSEEGKANLATYIVHRKMILEVLQKRLEIGEKGYAREEAVHRLIFPMRKTSDDVGYEEQNLWMIDERLSYHYYLASDKALSTIPPAESDSAKEPDLIVFNRPIALNDRPEGERLESTVIIEFKRPGETSVDGKKNPVDQILEYIEIILADKAESRRGRPIVSTPGMYFFGYAICELDPLLKKVLKRANMRETPDGRGMFGFFEEHRAYIEVISYEKMLDDANKRNRILFDKLQMAIH